MFPSFCVFRSVCGRRSQQRAAGFAAVSGRTARQWHARRRYNDNRSARSRRLYVRLNLGFLFPKSVLLERGADEGDSLRFAIGDRSNSG